MVLPNPTRRSLRHYCFRYFPFLISIIFTSGIHQLVTYSLSNSVIPSLHVSHHLNCVASNRRRRSENTPRDSCEEYRTSLLYLPFCDIHIRVQRLKLNADFRVPCLCLASPAKSQMQCRSTTVGIIPAQLTPHPSSIDSLLRQRITCLYFPMTSVASLLCRHHFRSRLDTCGPRLPRGCE